MSGSETISLRGVAAAVVVDVGLLGGLREAFVKIFCGVFFEVEARDADTLFGAANFGLRASRW